MADSFSDRFAAVRQTRGPLTWGLDPSGDVLDDWELGDTPDGLERFVDIVVPVAADAVGLIKPQAAFYERHGWRGMRALSRLINEARSAGLLVVLDAKRGDVGSTNQAYAEAYLGPDAPMRADALTVHPYLGVAAMGDFVERAAESGSCVLVVTRSSNLEGRSVQAAIDRDRCSVEQSLLAAIADLNAAFAQGKVGPVGAVIGPTHMEPHLDLVAPNALYWRRGSAGRARPPRTWPACSARARTGCSPARRVRCSPVRTLADSAMTSTGCPPSSTSSSGARRSLATHRRCPHLGRRATTHHAPWRLAITLRLRRLTTCLTNRRARNDSQRTRRTHRHAALTGTRCHSLYGRQMTHNPKVVDSNPTPATT